MNNKVQLITYVNRIGGENISSLKSLLNNQLNGLFGGVHLLPFFYPIDGEDAGFDPINHRKVDERLGSWSHIKDLSESVEVMADLIVNHISAKSDEFQDYLKHGSKSKYKSLFLSYDSIFTDGASEKDLLAIYRPRPGFPFTKYEFKEGFEKLIWTTFTKNQIDIDVFSDLGKDYLTAILNTFQQSGIKMIRLDAAGYAVKKKGTSCFMIKESFDFISELTHQAKSRKMDVLVEIHSHYLTQIKIAKKVDYVYDFALPILVLDTIFNKNAKNLKNWITIRPNNTIIVLDTHDGIGIVDVASENNLPGLIEDNQLNDIVNKIHLNSGNESRKATGSAASNLDLYQINCTYFSALAKNENEYLIARAIQFFLPGIPQVYYVGLFAGENDMSLLKKTNVGRDINRHYFTIEEINQKIETPFFKKFESILKLRNEHPAFNGDFSLEASSDEFLILKWTNENDSIRLKVDLNEMKMEINY
ncbi:MAG: sucrose phosphorylase [Lutibacter sp.]